MFDFNEAKKNYSLVKNIKIAINDLVYTGVSSYVYVVANILCELFIPLILVLVPAYVVAQLQSNIELTIFFMQLAIILFVVLVLNVIRVYSSQKIKLASSMILETRYWAKLNMYLLRCSIQKLENSDEQNLLKGVSRTLYEDDGTGKKAGVEGFYFYAVALVFNTLGFLVFASMTSSLDYIFFVVLFVLSIINAYVQNKAIVHEVNNIGIFWVNSGKFWHLKNEARDITKAKDIRMYRLKEWFDITLKQNTKEAVETYSMIRKKYLSSSMVIAFTSLLRDGFAYIFLIYQIKEGQIDLAQFVLYIGVVASFGIWINKIIESYSLLSKISKDLSVFRTFIETEDICETKKDCTFNDCEGIEFNQVSFSYGEFKVFDNFSLHIHKGEKIALVGINGSGKTTLVKMLCGLYEVEAGSILYNGENINVFNKNSYYELFSILFQDIQALPFSIAENIACTQKEFTKSISSKILNKGFKDLDMGESNQVYDESKIITSIKKAGLWDKISSLDKGIHTTINKVLDPDGMELSGGQTQRLMLARSLYKDAPVLILDEPTSALDPIAESELYEEYASLCEGKTSIFISHRLSSTRFCDRILFLEEGKIVEEGTHDELMSLHGKYANMYEIQAHYYQQEVLKNEAGL